MEDGGLMGVSLYYIHFNFKKIGGSFSGKDGTKIDRCGSYAARLVAKSLVHAGLCKRVLVQMSYAIGQSEPLGIYVNSYGTAVNGKTDKDLVNIVNTNFDLKPGVLVKELNLKRAIYKKTSVNGHFGRSDPDFTWEEPRKLKI